MHDREQVFLLPDVTDKKAPVVSAQIIMFRVANRDSSLSVGDSQEGKPS